MSWGKVVVFSNQEMSTKSFLIRERKPAERRQVFG